MWKTGPQSSEHARSGRRVRGHQVHRADRGDLGEDFGGLKDSGDLATDVDKVWQALKEELQAGKSRLNSVEKAIDQVETNLRKASKASGG